jgi:hypothetical protein
MACSSGSRSSRSTAEGEAPGHEAELERAGRLDQVLVLLHLDDERVDGEREVAAAFGAAASLALAGCRRGFGILLFGAARAEHGNGDEGQHGDHYTNRNTLHRAGAPMSSRGSRPSA